MDALLTRAPFQVSSASPAPYVFSVHRRKSAVRTPPRSLSLNGIVLGALLLLHSLFSNDASAAPAPSPPISPSDSLITPFRTNDVLAFLGGRALGALLQHGHLESILIAADPHLNLKFRNLSREGDTTFQQAREVNYPSPIEQLTQQKATLAFLQFGQMESISSGSSLNSFIESYRDLITRVQNTGARVILISPHPFLTSPSVSSEETSSRNAQLTAWIPQIKTLATERQIQFIDVFSPILSSSLLQNRPPSESSVERENQFHFTIAQIVAKNLLPRSQLLPSLQPHSIVFESETLEQLRQQIIRKNQHWFHYSRPTNWAFLAGDRTEQLSSRDHINPKIRWFPAEMEQFVPIIHQAENSIHQFARQHWGGSPGDIP